jgi:hypothetical protein
MIGDHPKKKRDHVSWKHPAGGYQYYSAKAMTFRHIYYLSRVGLIESFNIKKGEVWLE